MIHSKSNLTPWLLISVVALFACLGCGSGNPQNRKAVSGKVNVNGAPLAGGAINFEPIGGGTVGSGAMITAGTYAMAEKEGLPPGKYRVTITGNEGAGFKPSAGKMPGDEDMPATKSLVPPDWKQEIEVKEQGPVEFNFDISDKK